jgi:hypothetical protein
MLTAARSARPQGGARPCILTRVIAGFLLVLGGGLVALGSHRDWLSVHLPGDGIAVLNVVGSRFGTAMLVFAALIVALGIARIARGYAEDRSLHLIASLGALAVVVLALVRICIFLVDHNLSLGSLSSYGRLDLKSGGYLLCLGVVVTVSSRLA